jgi:hypothetical protein
LIRIDVTSRDDGIDIATCGTIRVTGRNGVTHAICRELVAAGHPDGPWESWHDGRRSLIGRSIHRHALRTLKISDTAETSTWWAPHPHAKIHPILERLFLAASAARETASDARSARVGAAKAQKPLASRP